MLYLPTKMLLGGEPAARHMQPSRLTLKSLWRLYNTAQALLKNGHTEDAAHHFHRVAAARIRKGRTQEIEADDTNPLIAQARLGLCYCYVEQGRLDQALAELETVLGLEPTNAEALCELAYIQTLRGQRPDAREALEAA